MRVSFGCPMSISGRRRTVPTRPAGTRKSSDEGISSRAEDSGGPSGGAIGRSGPEAAGRRTDGGAGDDGDEPAGRRTDGGAGDVPGDDGRGGNGRRGGSAMDP